jgi:hypothetical protein
MAPQVGLENGVESITYVLSKKRAWIEADRISDKKV